MQGGIAKISEDVEVLDAGDEYVIFEKNEEVARVSAYVVVTPPLG